MTSSRTATRQGVGSFTNSMKEVTMTLDQIADGLLAGTLTVEDAEAMTARPAPVIPDSLPMARSIVEDAPSHGYEDDEEFQAAAAALGLATVADPQALCSCDRDERARALYLHREGVAQLDDWQTIRAGLNVYGRLPKWNRAEWLAGPTPEAEAVRGYFDLLGHVRDVEEHCEAVAHYRETALEVELGQPVYTSTDPEHIIPEADRWNEAEWRRLAWPLVSFQHHYHGATWTKTGTVRGDGDRGYRADPTNIASESTLDREYAPTRILTVTDYERDDDGYVLLEDDGSRREVSREVKRSGEVVREYDRRRWCEDNGRFYLPWMSPRDFAFHAAALRRFDRMMRRRKTQRVAVARLVQRLGHDYRDPKIAEWVRAVGYEAALRALTARLRQQVAA